MTDDLNRLHAERDALAERVRGLEEAAKDARAVLLYCRDQFEWEKKFRANEYTLALVVIRALLGEPQPEPGSLFSTVMKIARRAALAVNDGGDHE